nr:uncharacterized protein LOC128697061 isoform X1 [Cherax quadricarinatus]
MNTRSNKEELGRNWLKEVIKPGLQASQVIGIYNDASKIYDQYTVDCKYQGPTIMAEEVARLVAEELRHEVRVLDVGAGTGLLGRELHKLGFSNIDALEPSEGMMNILKNTGHYRVKYQELMVVGQHTVPQDTYDLLVMCGSMAPGHIPAQCVEDFIRVTKPGGWVVLLIRLEYLLTAEDYKDKLEAHMNRLQKENMWCKEVRKVVPNYCTDHEGVLFIYRVL